MSGTDSGSWRERQANSAMQVDVIVCADRDGTGVAESLRWLGAQSFSDWRAVVVAAQVDGAAEAARAFNKAMGGERAVVVAGGSGEGAALRNAGLAAATGRYVLFLEAGEKMLPRGLDRLVAAARAGHGIGVGGVGLEREGQRVGPAMSPPAGAFGLHELLDGFMPSGPGVLVERALLEGKRFGANLARWSEIDLWLRLSETGARWRSTESVVALRPVGVERSGPAWTAAADELERVVRRSFGRAAANGWEEAELTEARETAAVVRGAMVVATVAAFTDADERLAGATGVMRERAAEGCVSAELAAETAASALMLAGGLAPAVDGLAEKRWVGPLHRWWSRCVSERWAERGLGEAAVALLAARLVADEKVAGALVERLGPAGRLMVAGGGRTAFAAADAAVEKGWRVAMLPFGGARGFEALVAASGDRFEVVAGGVDDPRAPMVIALEDEAAAMERFSGRPNVMRFSAMAREVTAAALARLRAAWPRRGDAGD